MIERRAQKPSRIRYRARLARRGEARRLTHLAQIESLRRALLASGLPIVMDRRRRRPRPKLAFGPAISVGYESLAEYFDLLLDAALAPKQVSSALAPALQTGLSMVGVRRIPLFFPSLDASVNVVRYEIRGVFPDDGAGTLEDFLRREEIVIEKLKKGGTRVERVDARPLILNMALTAPGCLGLTLRFGPKQTVKPEALVRDWLRLGPPALAGVAAPSGEGASAPSPGPRVDASASAAPAGPSEPLEGFRIVRQELYSETSSGELLTP
ncbi:MAG: TIGR03936 family radical SAM-associated protein [Elusimicrobiota bacterium]